MRIINVALLGFLIAEVVSLVLAGRWLGVGWTLLWLAADVVLGVVLIRNSFRTILRQLRGGLPSEAWVIGFLAGAQLHILSGLLMLIPGFTSDLIALILLLPPVKGAIRRKAETWMWRHPPSSSSGVVIEGEAVEIEPPPIGSRRNSDEE